MDLNVHTTILLSMLSLSCHFAESLIGLRPPRKSQSEEKQDVKHVKPVSPRPTQLHSPYDNLSVVHNITVDEDAPLTDTSTSHCKPVPLLRCSYKLLRQTLQNDTNICRRIQSFSGCCQSGLREGGRRDFAIGIDFLDDFTRIMYSKQHCHRNASSTLPDHTRHQRSKRYGSHCCVDGLIECATQTFMKMAFSRGERCQLVDFYELCLHETKDTCHFKSLDTLYPVFTLQLKRKCKSAKIRQKWGRIDTKYEI